MTRTRQFDAVEGVKDAWNLFMVIATVLHTLMLLILGVALVWGLVILAQTETAAFVWAMIIAVVYKYLRYDHILCWGCASGRAPHYRPKSET